jgi:hypothetical protein
MERLERGWRPLCPPFGRRWPKLTSRPPGRSARLAPTLLATLVFSAAILSAPIPASAQECPPMVNSPSLQPLLDQCESWQGVVYDPTEGYLPENHPEYPWNASYDPDTTVELRDGKLVVTGPTTSSLIEIGAAYWRDEAALLDPANSLYLLQVRQRMTYILPIRCTPCPGTSRRTKRHTHCSSTVEKRST